MLTSTVLPRFLLLALLLLSTGGCGGCRLKKAEEKPPPKPPPDFELKWAGVLPAEPKTDLLRYKPGHWSEVSISAVANNFDFVGGLELSLVDAEGRPVGLPWAPFQIACRRPIALPKGQLKTLDTLVPFPLTAGSLRLSCRLISPRGGTVAEIPLPAMARAPYQYCLVVLARMPQRYAYLNRLTNISPTEYWAHRAEPALPVVPVTPDRRPPLPSQSLAWTSIAVLVWDDFAPETLAPQQQQALLDWLHWGGQLVASGRDSFDQLKNSFLGPYLPAVEKADTTWTGKDLGAIAEFARQPGTPLRAERPWPGVRLRLHSRGRWLAEPLVAERRVGGGRIVLSGFRLAARDLVTWPALNSFFRRLLDLPATALPQPAKPDEDLDRKGPTAPAASEISRVSFLARDAGQPDGMLIEAQDKDPDTLEPARGTGAAAWSDFSAVPSVVRGGLTEAARVRVPSRWFVVRAVALYLVVLVPLNWLAFRLLERPEWTWAAAPIIALVSAAAVVHSAELNVGFARSQTEIDLVEAQADYPRAHVSRYAALYTSLATRYRVRFPAESGGLAQPFPTVRAPGDFAMLPGQRRTELRLERDEESRLSGMAVPSNSTGLVHCEQMIDLGGTIRLASDSGGGPQVVNQSTIALRDAALIRKARDGTLEKAWLGTIEAGRSVGFHYLQHRGPQPIWPTERERAEITARTHAPGVLSLRALLDVAEDPQHLEPGQGRLVAWLDQLLPGQRIEPAADDVRGGSVVVVNFWE